MQVYSISYDLNSPGQNYTGLFIEIKSLGSWWHCLDSSWLVATNLSAVHIRDRLITKIDKNDKLLVACLSGEAAWQGFEKQCSEWLKDSFQREYHAM